MLVKVGTNNAIKVTAVREALANYPVLANAEINGINVSSRVDEQPKSMDETVTGALNRALGAFRDGADLGIGIESGLMNGPLGWMNFSAAVVCEQDSFEGWLIPEQLSALWSQAHQAGFHFGHSTGFPLPNAVVDRMLFRGMDLDRAVYDCQLVKVPNIGKVEGGFLGVLTRGRVSRMEYSKQALQMALISYENKEMFLNA